MPSFFERFRNKYLPPNSKLELWLRTLYHNFNKTRLAFQIRDRISRTSCKRWVKRSIADPLLLTVDVSNKPELTFILSVSNTESEEFLKTYESIYGLIGDRWNIICICSDWEEEGRPSLIVDADRVRFLSMDLKDAVNSIPGGYILFCKPGDVFARSLLLRFYEALAKDDINVPDVLYYDCEYRSTRSTCQKKKLFFKPSKPSTDLLLSVNYFSRGIVRLGVLAEIKFEFEQGNLQTQEYRLFLAIMDKASIIIHMPFVLVAQEDLVKTDYIEDQKVIVDHLDEQGVKAVQAINTPSGTRFTWPVEDHSVAIIIPTVNNRSLLEPLVASIFANEHKNFSLHIVDNGSTDQPTLAYYHEIEDLPNVSIIPYKKKFNYSEAINLGVSQSDSDLLLFLNDDMQSINKFWLQDLIQWASLPRIGVVGTKLIRRNHTIQHARIVIGLNNFAGHIYLNAPEHYDGLLGSVDWYRNYLAITGACQMVRRTVFEEVGGYDEGFELAFGDIDFCLKVSEKGYENMYTPFANLFHFEGQSRGYVTPSADIIEGFTKMEELLKNGDPYFPGNLSLTSIPRCQDSTKKNQFASVEKRKDYYHLPNQ